MLEIDSVDAKILGALQKNGRASLSDISGLANRSQTAVHQRMARLQATGVIKGYRTELAIEKAIPMALFCVLVALDRHKNRDFERFESAMRERTSILECHALGGHFDYIVKVLIERHDTAEKHLYAVFHADIGVSHYRAHLLGRHAMRMTRVPIQHLLAV